ncbi:MAG: MotA/TolQ/ExbB proton channel family protein [Nitrospirae bacterium]|nr:MotA/TolQ/ExbB proton channel family protein [Nitrospirota bacterium]
MGFLVSGMATICLFAMISMIFKDVGIGVLFNFDAFLIVIGGTATALLIGFPVKRITATIHDLIATFRSVGTREDITQEIVRIARMHRKSELRKLEASISDTKDAFLKIGINMLLNGYKSEEIRNTMEREMATRIIDLNLSQNVLMTMARLTPSFGLAGTVISLIKIFRHFQSFETVIPIMAIALMSTFYGVFLSNLILLPLSAKIKERAILCEELMQMTVEGIVEINKGEYPLKIEEKLLGCSDADTERYVVKNINALRSAKSLN